MNLHFFGRGYISRGSQVIEFFWRAQVKRGDVVSISEGELIPWTTVCIKQYWHFQRVTGKQYYTLFHSIKQHIFIEFLANQTIVRFSEFFLLIILVSERYCETILTYSELMSNSIHIFTEALPNSSNTFLRVSMDTWRDRWF